MFNDPLLDWVQSVGLSPLLAFILLPPISIAFSHLLVYFFSAKRSKSSKAWKALRSDSTENFFWPFFVLGTSAVAFIFIGDLDREIHGRFEAMDFQFEPINWFGDTDLIFPFSIVLGAGIAIFSAIRFHQKGIPVWLVESKWTLFVKAFLVSTPMGAWTITTLFRLSNHFWAFREFANSDWIPKQIYFADGAFGLEWLREIIQIELLLLIVFSFMPLIMMIQIKNLKRVNLYTMLSAGGILVVIFVILPIILGVDQQFESIHSTLFSEISEDLAPFYPITELKSAEEVAIAAALEQRLANIALMPNSLGSSSFFQLAISVSANLLGLGYSNLETIGNLLGRDLDPKQLFGRSRSGK